MSFRTIPVAIRYSTIPTLSSISYSFDPRDIDVGSNRFVQGKTERERRRDVYTTATRYCLLPGLLQVYTRLSLAVTAGIPTYKRTMSYSSLVSILVAEDGGRQLTDIVFNVSRWSSQVICRQELWLSQIKIKLGDYQVF